MTETYLPMREAVRVLKAVWTPHSIHQGFREGKLKAELQIDSTTRLPIPRAYWNNWRMGSLAPETLQLGDLHEWINTDIRILKEAVGANQEIADPSLLMVLGGFFTGANSNPPAPGHHPSIAKRSLTALEFLWLNEAIDHEVMCNGANMRAFSGEKAKRTYGGRIPKSGGDAFYIELVSNINFDPNGVDIGALKNTMDRWVKDNKLNANQFSGSFIKRRIEGLILARKTRLATGLETET